MAVAVIMSAMTFVSCEEPFELPEVIESEVLDEGIEETITETPSTDPEGASVGTELSYKSWIMVKGQTRAAFEERVEVTLTNVFNNTDTTVIVDNFELGDYTTSLSHKVRKTREDGFVDIVDSILVYTVSFENFSFDYELDYEVATYDDGYTKQLMPYHQIGTIKDKGYKVEDLEFVKEYTDEKEYERVFLRKLLTHSISVEFNDKNYELTAKVELRKFVGNHPCIVESFVTASRAEIIGESIYSVLNVHRRWSDGKTEDKAFTKTLLVYLEANSVPAVTIENYNNDLKVTSTEVVKVSGELVDDDTYVDTYRCGNLININYNYFTLTMKVIQDSAWYDDGILKCEFPCIDVTSVTTSTPNVVYGESGEDNKGKYSIYWLYQGVNVKIDKLSLETECVLGITSYETVENE